MKKYIVSIIIVITTVFAGIAQEIPNGMIGNNLNANPQQQGDDKEKMDSLGYNVPSIIKTWKLTNYNINKDTVMLDTILGNQQNYNPIYKNSISNSYLGNIGSASVSNIYIDRDNSSSFLFFRPYSSYIVDPDDITFFNTTTPYTSLFYATGGSKGRSENYLKVLHTQNIKAYWNIGIQYNLISSYGKYQNQKTKVYDFSLFSTYKKRRINIDFVLNSNRIKNKDNGGLKADSLLSDKSEKSENLQTGLTDANTQLTNFNFFVNGKYGIGRETELATEQDTTFSYPMHFAYTFHYQLNSWSYKDNDLTSEYYKKNLLSSLSTFDKVQQSMVKNSFQMIFNENANRWIRLGARFGLVSEFSKYQLRKQLNKYTWKQKPENIHNSTLVASLFSQSGKSLNWQATAAYVFEGYQQHNIKLLGDITKWIGNKEHQTGVRAYGRLESYKPNIIFDEYYGNHQSWKNNFGKITEIQAKGEYFNTKYKLKAGVSLNQVENYVYFGLDTLPHQASSGISIFTAYANKDFKLGNFHLNQKVVFQKGSNDNVLPLPTLSVYSNNYYQNTFFKGALGFQVGVAIRYNTAFKAPAYMPATGQFYLQNKTDIGNYPKVDAYINFRIRRTRLFFMYEHANSSIGNRKYFSTQHYPIAPAMFKYGLIWTFYN